VSSQPEKTATVIEFPRQMQYKGYLIQVKAYKNKFAFEISQVIQLQLTGIGDTRNEAVDRARVMIDDLSTMENGNGNR